MPAEKNRIENPSEGSLRLGCVFCRSGSEDRLIPELRRTCPALELLSPKKLRLRRAAGRTQAETVALFPGYIFFRTDADPDFRTLLRREHVYRLLRYPDGQWALTGRDRAVAEWLFAHDGVVGLSQACYQGDGIRVTEGALKGSEGSILSLNRRAQTAQVRLDFMGESMTLWLGYELIDPVLPG